MLEMLHRLDEVCRKYDIDYTLFAGTALGAVRHSGFVPWDDDLDVIMTRENYNRFLSVAKGEIDSERYYLQCEYSDHWPMFFTKLRKNNTAYMEKYHPRDRLMHQGVYIDIFPCDNLSDSKFVRKLQFLASKVVIAKSLDKRGYLTDSKKKKIFMAFCRLLPRAPFLALVKNRKATDSQCVHSFLGASSKFEKSIYKREWMTESKRMRFCDGEFPVSSYYDSLLTTLYGDYMTLPPEKERAVKVHAMKIDLEASYENYVDWQANQKIDVYTRSIR